MNRLEDRLKDFIGEYVSLDHIKLHLEYKTSLWLEKDGEIVAYVQFNIKGTVAHITYLKIKEGLNAKRIMFYFIREGKRRFPFATHIKLERETRNDLKQRLFKVR